VTDPSPARPDTLTRRQRVVVLLDQFSGDYARVGLCSGVVHAAGRVIIWFVPRRAAGKLED